MELQRRLFFNYNTANPANSILNDADKAVAEADFDAYKAVIKTDNSDADSRINVLWKFFDMQI